MFKKISNSPLARNTAWMIFGQGLRLIIQALYFIEIARSLGVRNYGAFVGVVALVAIVYPFGALGSGNLLVKNVSRDKTLSPPTGEGHSPLPPSAVPSSFFSSWPFRSSLYLRKSRFC